MTTQWILNTLWQQHLTYPWIKWNLIFLNAIFTLLLKRTSFLPLISSALTKTVISYISARYKQYWYLKTEMSRFQLAEVHSGDNRLFLAPANLKQLDHQLSWFADPDPFNCKHRNVGKFQETSAALMQDYSLELILNKRIG